MQETETGKSCDNRTSRGAALHPPGRAARKGVVRLPLRYAIYGESRLVVSTAWGRLTYAEIKEHQDTLTSDPEFNPEFNQLIDLRRVTDFDVSIDEAKLAANRKLFSRESRRALVATSPAVFGMGRLLETYHEMSAAPSRVKVFYELSAALEWMGLESLPGSPQSAS